MKPVCPVCGAALIRTDGSFRCRRSHTFDVAGEGYVNLLVRPKRKILGDAKEMLRARRRFLSAGHWPPRARTARRTRSSTAGAAKGSTSHG